MDDKKLIVTGLVLAIVIGGAVWLFGQSEEIDQGPSGPSQIDFQDPVLGDENAPVTIVEYFSYDCSHCKNFHLSTFPIIKEKYIDTGQVKYIARQLFGIPYFPLAALCAAEQDKYWQYHDYMFTHREEIVSEKDLGKLKEFAAALGLNQEQFDSCYDELRYQDQIIAWTEDGQELGLTGVPVFFINNQKIEGNLPLSEFEKAIEQELNK